MSVIEHPEVPPYLTEWPERIEHPPYSERDRMIQRLAARGTLKLRMEMEPTPIEKWALRGTYSTAYSLHDRPRWVVHVGYRYRGIFATILGWDDVHVEGYDLDEVLREALRKSEPERIWLHEAVWQKHSVLRDLFGWMASLNQPPPNARGGASDG